MVQGAVLITDGTTTLGIHEYLRSEPVVIGLLDPPNLAEINESAPSNALIEYVVYVIEVKINGL
jgi:hypothetical protein